MKKNLNTIKISLCTLLLILFSSCQSGVTGTSVTGNGFYGNSQYDGNVCDELPRSFRSEKEAEDLIKNILDKVGLQQNFGIAQCNGINNCQATIHGDKPYIVYDSDFLKEVKQFSFTNSKLPKTKANNWEAITILAHEIGHHLNQHLTNKWLQDENPKKLELEADIFAGNILYKLGASLEEAQKVMKSDMVSESGSVTHPSRSERLAAIKKGWEKAKKATPQAPTPPPTNNNTTTTTNITPPTNENTVVTPPKPDQPVLENMVSVQGGTFTMGCTSEQGSDCHDDEKPSHEVYVSDFYIGKHEVTVGEFEEFVNATGHKTDAEKKGKSWVYDNNDWFEKDGVSWRDDTAGNKRSRSDYNHPVIHVSWNDANAYAKWKGMRLPTEAEWEYAARGGSDMRSTKYAGSSSIDDVAWYTKTTNDSGTKTVGTKTANELGIYDMSGNVWEWCEDWYDGNFYKNSVKNNPINKKEATYRVLRGGSWSNYATGCRVAYRYNGSPTFSSYSTGFRLASSL